MSINSRSNQTYHQLQINSQKEKPDHHRDPSNHSLPQRRLRISPQRESGPPGICLQSRSKGSIFPPFASRVPAESQREGQRARPQRGQSCRTEVQGFSARRCQT